MGMLRSPSAMGLHLLVFLNSIIVAMGGVKGFGIVFSVKPEFGSTAGGTEVCIAGSGFAYATRVLFGGRICRIFEPATKDGQLRCYTPPGEHGNADVEVWFTSGHRAQWRGKSFRYRRQFTPSIEWATAGGPVLSNMTFKGDLKKTLQANQQELFDFTREKRNATELMHAYLGTGLELLADKGGPDEFRCDFVETPNINTGICTVNELTPAGYYNLTYVLDDFTPGGKKNKDDLSNGYGQSSKTYYGYEQGVKSVNMAGQEYDAEIFPTLHSMSEPRRTGRLGGAKVVLTADALAPKRGSVATRYQVLLDGVPCTGESATSIGGKDKLTCVTGNVSARPNYWPVEDKQPPPGYWPERQERAKEIGLAPRLWDLPGSTKRALDMSDNWQVVVPQGSCAGTNTHTMINAAVSAKECADWCFNLGDCRWFYWAPFRTSDSCRWCVTPFNNASSAPTLKSPGYGRRRRDFFNWDSHIGGGVYKLLSTGNEYLLQNNKGPTWKLVSNTQKCDVGYFNLDWVSAKTKTLGFGPQECADACAAMRTESDGGMCRYFGVYHDSSDPKDKTRCQIYQPPVPLGTAENGKPRCTSGELVEGIGWYGVRTQNVYELTKPTPHSPQPTGMYPGGRGVLYRVWNACPDGGGFYDWCSSWRTPFMALYAAFNPEYKAQTPMFEGIRGDQLRGPFGTEPESVENPDYLKPFSPDLPYQTMGEASGNRGLVFEIMGFFVAPFTANYSFMVWGNGHQDMWMSTSNQDPSQTVQVAEAMFGQSCRALTPAQSTRIGCSVFDSVIEHNNIRSQHVGRLLNESFNFSGDPAVGQFMHTPTTRTLPMRAGERRFFVKRVQHAESSRVQRRRRRNVDLVQSRRRRYIDGTGVRIHNPDLSAMTPAAREKLQAGKGWPEMLLFTNIKDKSGGTWRFGITETLGGDVTWSRWQNWNSNEWTIKDSFKLMTLPSGQVCFAECWYISNNNTHNQYMCYVWRPSGKLLPVQIEGNNLRSTWIVRVAMPGAKTDLFLWPIPGSMLEAPALSPSSQLSVTGINAIHLSNASHAEVPGVNDTDNITQARLDMPVHPGIGNMVFPCAAPQNSPPAFRYYRWQILKVRDANSAAGTVRMAEFNIYDGTGSVVDLSSATVTSDCAIDAGSSLANLVDGSTSTDILLASSESSKESCTFSFDLGAGQEKALEMWGFATTSASSNTDPTQWLLQGSADNSLWHDVTVQNVDPADINPRSTLKGTWPNALGQSDCGQDSSGCSFGQTFQGSVSGDIFTEDAIPYPSWHECQRRCCYNPNCKAAYYRVSTQSCRLVTGPFEGKFQVNTDYRVANIMSRQISTSPDGYGVTEKAVDVEGLPLIGFTGHRLVSFCKRECDLRPDCHSFAYKWNYGCHLKTGCVSEDSMLAWYSDGSASFVTFYKRNTANCKNVSDMSTKEVNTLSKASENCSVLTAVIPDSGNINGDLQTWSYSTRSTVLIWGLTQEYKLAVPGSSYNSSSGEYSVVASTNTRRLSSGEYYYNTTGSSNATGSYNASSSITSTTTRTTTSATRATISTNRSYNGSLTTTSTTSTTTSTTTLPEGSYNASQEGSYNTSSSTTLTNPASQQAISTTTNTTTTTKAPNTTTSTTTTTMIPEVRVVKAGDVIVNAGDAVDNAGMSGRLEVRYLGIWGTICDDGFGVNSAKVACNQLGYLWGFVKSAGTVTDGSGDIWLRNVACTGSESRIDLCPRDQWFLPPLNSNCYHNEDVGVTCEMTTTTTTAPLTTTTTTTTWADMFQVPTVGFIRNTLGGSCINPNGAPGIADGTVLNIIKCEYHVSDTDQEFELTYEGFIKSKASGKCIDVAGNVGTADGSALQLNTCQEDRNFTEFSEHRWVVTAEGFIRNQFSGKCIQTKSHRWDALKRVGNRGGMELELRTCDFLSAVVDHKWQFVQRQMAPTSTTGYIRSKRSNRCIDVRGETATTAGADLRLYDCAYNQENTDQRWTLTSEGFIKSLLSHRCIDVKGGVGITASGTALEIADCDASDGDQKWEVLPGGYIRNKLSGKCIDVSGSPGTTNNKDLQLDDCNTDDTYASTSDHQWEFVDVSNLPARCWRLCQDISADEDKSYNWWDLDSSLYCNCRSEVISLRTQYNYLGGFLKPFTTPLGLDYTGVGKPPTVRSSLADLQVYPTPDFNNTDRPLSPFSFSYLSEAEQPFVSRVLVNNIDSLNISDGDTLTIVGGNFDDVNLTTVEIMIGPTRCIVTELTFDRISCIAPLSTYARINLRVRLGWKGWIDFGPLVVPGTGKMKSQVAVIFGGGQNVLTSSSPAEGSMKGGLRLTIVGKGFKIPSALNDVLLQRASGEMIECVMYAATLSTLQCVTPVLNLSTWSSTQFQEELTLIVNGVQSTDSGGTLTYIYSLSQTPVVLTVEPPSLSYAITADVTLIGYNFGLLQRRVTVRFGERPCTVSFVSQTRIVCQLMRTAMASPPLCTKVADVYDTNCIAKPFNYSVQPTVLVAGKGNGDSRIGSTLDSRFEIHSVSPSLGSTEGGAEVTVKGIGFGSLAWTSMLMVAVLGTLGDYTKWTPTEIVFTTRKLTLNTNLVDINTNLITAEHNCGVDQTKGPCKYGAFREGMTPDVTALSPASGRAGETMSITVQMPPGQGLLVNFGSIAVTVGGHVCPHLGASGSLGLVGDVVSITCTIPEFDASDTTVQVLVLPLGNAKFTPESLNQYTQQLIVDSVTPNQGSIGGAVVTFAGAGFSTTPTRHFVKVGGNSEYGMCEPVSSSYSSLTCIMNWKDYDQDNKGTATQDLSITLWDREVWADPLSVFGKTMTGCIRGNDDWRTYDCLSTTECALRCLARTQCVSFDYRPRYQSCFLSKASFTKTASASDQRWLNCRYYELLSEAKPSSAVSVAVSGGFKYDSTLTPNILGMFLNEGIDRPKVFTADTGCGANHPDAWLKDSNSACCSSSNACALGEGSCSNSNYCAGNLVCQNFGCPWSYKEYNGALLGDKCCVAQSAGGFPLSTPLWKVGDTVTLRLQRIGTADYGNYNLADTSVQAAIASPGNGYISVSFDSLPCPVTAIQFRSGNNYHDITCTLPEVPGGLAHSAVVDIQSMGRASEPAEWLFVPLEIIDASLQDGGALAGSDDARGLGGGWILSLNGTGFAQPPSANNDSFVEVAVCGRLCEVITGSYSSIECTMPAITTPTLADGSLSPMEPPRASIVSRGASSQGVVSPTCFHGANNEMETGHPLCAAVFDGDPELTGGFTKAGCQLGLDFGDSNVRVEEIRFHPEYDVLQATKYQGSKIELGVLDATQTCDELSYGWRGDSYRGCQDTASSGDKCLQWDTTNYPATVPELSTAGSATAGYCRNPNPYSKRGIWCRTSKGNRYCNPKMPSITWTTLHEIKKTPRMLWNSVRLETPQIGRFVRFYSAMGQCLLTEMEVRGQFVAPSETCDIAVRNVRRAPGRGSRINVARPAWKTGLHNDLGFMETASHWEKNPAVRVDLTPFLSPTITAIVPTNGSARGGTLVTLTGTNLGPYWTTSNDTNTSVIVTLNTYDCQVVSVNSDRIQCITSARNKGINKPAIVVRVGQAGLALIKPLVSWRYLDRWSDTRTWANREPPVDGDIVMVPDGQAIMLDQDTPKLLLVTVQGIMVWDDTKDLQMHATYIWVKGGTFEIGTELNPFKHQAVITLYGNKYEAVRLPGVGGKCLALSNEQFTIRESGDGAEEPGNVGTLDIHGQPRLVVWTRTAETMFPGDTVMVLQEQVDWKPGEELVLTATEASHKHFDGNGLMGAPPVDFHDERVIIESVALDMKTITLVAPVVHKHLSTHYWRPDGEYVDLSAEVALLTRNVKIQGDPTSELDSWGGHTMVAFGGIYRIENAEFYRMGQQGEMSRYPIHFHVSQEWGRLGYVKYNSIHHSFQRAVALHGTDYVLVKGNVGFDIVGHMFFIETGMEKYNTLEGNIGIGAIPLLSGMLESDQEPAAFWTAAPNNVWIDNVAVTGSDGWYFQLPGKPISQNEDIYKDSVCPIGDKVGGWERNRCHHTTGTCIRVYMDWLPSADPCNVQSGEVPQILFNTTCWGVGNNCFFAMLGLSIHNHHMTSIETGNSDIFHLKFNRGSSYDAAKWTTDWLGIPHVKDSVFVGVLPENLATSSQKFKANGFEMPQDENWWVSNTTFHNFLQVPCLKDCCKCWATPKWRQGAFTYDFEKMTFINSPKRIYVQKKGIYHDLDGSLVNQGPNTYTTWADKHNLGHPSCIVTNAIQNLSADPEWLAYPKLPEDAVESDSVFYVKKNVLIHSRRDYSFITCTVPIRKFEVAYPEPQEVYLRQLNITNLDTGFTHVYEYEDKDIFGWTFPVVTNQRLEIRPNFIGLDFSDASLRYGVTDLFMRDKQEATLQKREVAPEWFQLKVKSWSNWDHYNLQVPDWQLLATRKGDIEGNKWKDTAIDVAYQEIGSAALLTPSTLDSMTSGMFDSTNWGITFAWPRFDAKQKLANLKIENEPLSARFEAKRCPEKGCTAGLPPLVTNWTTFELWSVKFGDATGQNIVIDAPDWIVFDMPSVSIKNLTLNGKLSFDDSASRTLETDHIVVWGLLEIGTEAAPFGQDTGSVATIKLRGSATDVQTYVYIEEQTLHNKLIAVVGAVETYGAVMQQPWLRLEKSASAGATSACVQNSDNVTLSWPTGSEVVFAPTEWDNPAGHVETRTLTRDAVYDGIEACWLLTWSGGLSHARYAGEFPIGGGKTLSLRAVAARVDRTVVFESLTTDGTNRYGGHFEIFDLPEMTPMRVGKVKMYYTRFKDLGKAGLSAAVKVGYQSNFQPPPANILWGCSWSGSLNYAFHSLSSNAPVILKDNAFTNSDDGGIFVQSGTNVQIRENVVIGVRMSPVAAFSTNELSSTTRVYQFAGIRVDVTPSSMFGNVVAGVNDIGFMHRAEKCGVPVILNNEAFAVIVGVSVQPQKSGSCQTVNLYKVWKAAHIGIFLADILTGTVQMSHITISDTHIGIVPYFTVGRDYRRLIIKDSNLIGSSPASSCSASVFCRAQITFDGQAIDPTLWGSLLGCNSVFAPINFRRVGMVMPLNTGNKKTCDVTMSPLQCRQLGMPYPNLECHFPWEYHNHFDRGMGWVFVERMTFAYWKESDCSGYTSRALSMNPSAAEIQFPATFSEVTWYESDPAARFELSAETLNSALVGRKSPCGFDSGGCMGLDQLLWQDADGSLIGTHLGTPGTIVPFTPRTEIVWAPMCSNQLEGSTIDAYICVNTSVQLLEMRNLDRGAKDVKFGPLVLTPNVEEDNGFEGGVVSSVGPFYGVCPCGWDFSFYHILVRPQTTYYAETMSLPENFRLRYWSPNPDESLLLQFFYPDSRGVNVFVGSGKKAPMELKLARKPTLGDLHGAHVVDAQGLRLHVTLRGSKEGFNSQRDLIVRRTPTVKLKMNVEISMVEFNGANFATNLAILLGVPPERIKVVAVGGRRLQSDRAESIHMKGDSSDCHARARRLVASATALDVSITPSSDVGAAASGGSTDTSQESMSLQTNELNQVSQNLGALATGPSLAQAAGGAVSVTEMQVPAPVDSSASETVSAEDVAPDITVDITALASAQATATVSTVAPCPTTLGVQVTVAGMSGTVYASETIASGSEGLSDCASINSGYEGNITMTCEAGALDADPIGCVPLSCTDAVPVTVGATTTNVAPTSALASGITQSMACSGVQGSFTGTYFMSCNLGVLTVDATGCKPGCLSTLTVVVSVAGSSTSWSPAADMQSGSVQNVNCEPINSGYAGTVEIKCYFGLLSTNPSNCYAKPCAKGNAVSVTLGATTQSVALATQISSGLTGLAGCSAVNAQYSGDMVLSCAMGVLTDSTAACTRSCLTSETVSAALGGTSTTISPIANLNSGSIEYNRQCSALNAGFTGTYTMLCTMGTLTLDTSACTEKTCTTSTSVVVTVGSDSKTVSPDITVASGGSLSMACDGVSAVFTGVITLSCSRGALTASTSACAAKPCEPWDFVAGTVEGVSGLVFPLASIPSGTTGVGSCGSANIEYSGEVSMSCSLGSLTVTDTSQCRLTCFASSTVAVTIDSTSFSITPAARIDHGATGVQTCASVRPGYSGDVTLSCSNGVSSFVSAVCTPDPCTAASTTSVVVGSFTGLARPTAEIASSGSGIADCRGVNPGSTGTIEISCYAAAITVVSIECKLSCSTATTAPLFVSGRTWLISPAALIDHQDYGEQKCSQGAPGHSGTALLQCMDGFPSVINMSCVPHMCNADAMNITLSGMTANSGSLAGVADGTKIAHDTVWNIPCSQINSVFRGDLVMMCYAGQVIANTSECGAPCNGTHSLAEDMGRDVFYDDEDFQVQCSTLSNLHEGTFNVSCENQKLTPDTSSCTLACPDTDSQMLTFNGDSRAVSPAARMSSGDMLTRSCATYFSPGVVGDFGTQCTQGALSFVDNTCALAKCPVNTSATVHLGGLSASFSTDVEVVHGDTWTSPCSSANSAYVGVAEMTCWDTEVLANMSDCAGPCDTNTWLAVSVGGVRKDIHPSVEAAHQGSFLVGCGTINPIFDRDISVTCFRGELSADTSKCKPLCVAPQSIPVQNTVTEVGVSAGTTTTQLQVTNSMTDGSKYTVPCGSVNASYIGDFVVQCSNTQMSAITAQSEISGKLTGCIQTVTACDSDSDSVSAEVDGKSKSFDTQEKYGSDGLMGSGWTFLVDCGGVNDLYAGSISIGCENTNLSADESGCYGLPCTVGSSIPVTIASLTGNAVLTSEVASGASTTMECSAAITNSIGSMSLSCYLGTHTADMTGCTATCAASTSASNVLFGDVVSASLGQTIQDGSNWAVSCPTMKKGTVGNGVLLCTGGVLSLLVDGCTPAPCATSMSLAVTIGWNIGALSPSEEISSGASDPAPWECSAINTNFAGNGSLSCSFGQLSVDPADCICIAQDELVCKEPCRNGTLLPGLIGDSAVTIELEDELKSGFTRSRNCSAATGYNGTFKLSCAAGTVSADTSTCFGAPCLTSYKFDVLIGGQTYPISPENHTASGSSFEAYCSDSNSTYEGIIPASCTLGNVFADSSSCGPRSCPVDEYIVPVKGYNLYMKLPGPPFGESTDRVSSGWHAAANCSSLHSGLGGRSSSTCSYGQLTVDTSACTKTCVANFTILATFAPPQVEARHANITVVQDIISGNSESRLCKDVFSGLEGTLRIGCADGTVSTNLSACSELGCSQGQIDTVGLGASFYDLPAPSDMASRTNFTTGCESIHFSYTGNVTSTCALGALSTSNGCVLKPGTKTEQVIVVSSAITMGLPDTQGSTVAEVHEAMQGQEVKDALCKTITGAVAVSADKCTVTDVAVTGTRRLSLAEKQGSFRRLATGMQMQVAYSINLGSTNSSSNATGGSANLLANMANLGNQSSQAGNAFSSSLGNNLVQAASGSGGSAILSGLSQNIQTNGITVLQVTPPQTVTLTVALTTTTTTTTTTTSTTTTSTTTTSTTTDNRTNVGSQADDDALDTKAIVGIAVISAVCVLVFIAGSIGCAVKWNNGRYNRMNNFEEANGAPQPYALDNHVDEPAVPVPVARAYTPEGTPPQMVPGFGGSARLPNSPPSPLLPEIPQLNQAALSATIDAVVEFGAGMEGNSPATGRQQSSNLAQSDAGIPEVAAGESMERAIGDVRNRILAQRQNRASSNDHDMESAPVRAD